MNIQFQKKNLLDRIKELERRNRLLKTDYFDKQIAECKEKLQKLEQIEKRGK
jgi:hypothetical protein